MIRLLWILGGVLVVLSLLAGIRIATRPPAEKIGNLLWSMTEIHTRHRDRLIQRVTSPSDKDVAARETAAELARHRDAIARLAPALDARSDFAIRVGRFLEMWPDAAAFQRDLLDESPSGSRSGADITGLAMSTEDGRLRWSTPFRLFRP